MRALAWWHAVPKHPPSTLKNPPKQLPGKQSRMQMRLDAGGAPDLPDVDPALMHFVEYLFEAGPTSAGGVGAIPLTWADLESWQRGSGVILPPWQARLLRALSAEYLSESMTADEHDAPPPWGRAADREKIAMHIRNVLRG